MRRGMLVWGILLILFGALLLLDSTGVIDVNVWGLIWPLFLLVAGIWFVWSVLAGPEQIGEGEEAAIHRGQTSEQPMSGAQCTYPINCVSASSSMKPAMKPKVAWCS